MSNVTPPMRVTAVNQCACPNHGRSPAGIAGGSLVVASFWLALSATAQEFPTAPVDASTASLYAPAASVDTSVASVDTSVASVDAPTSALDTSLASVDTPTSPLDAPAASVDAPVSPLDAPATSVGGPASSLDASASADASAAGAEADSTALSIEPIAGGDAAPDAEGSAAYAEASGEELRKVIPQAFLFRIATGAMYDDNLFQTEFDSEKISLPASSEHCRAKHYDGELREASQRCVR